ncbi:prolipoprotein diacylglyceryl transferase family protein [Thermogutta sp.]|uniref:prolipoprotein diacylglyceryl transferase family protein n=1 Tax=Thermogutta sp. TaxID=1962930 RepID=UPI0032204464
MWRTLFYIPERIGSVPLFGLGLLFWLWIAWSAFTLIWTLRRHGWTGEFWNAVVVHGLVAVLIAFLLPRLSVDIPGVYDGAGRPLRGLPVRGYGTMLLVAVLASVGLAIVRARKRGFSADWVANLALWCIIPGIIGARVFHVIEYWPVHYGPVWQTQGPAAGLAAVLNVTQGGLVVYGSLLGGLAGIAFYAWRQKVRLLLVFDLLAPCFLLGLAFGRIGCFLNGCCFGGVCELPWSVQFPAGSFAYLSQLEHGQLALYGIRFREDPRDPDRLPVIVEVLPHSAASRADVKPGEHIAEVNGRRLTGSGGQSPVAVLVEELVANSGNPVLIEGGRGCVCTATGAAPSFTQHPATSGNRPRASTEGVFLHIRTREGGDYVWESRNEIPARSLYVHPSQLYSAVNALILCLFLLAYEPFAKSEGELWAWLLTLYPLTRFILEIIRADEPGSYWGLTIAQVVSIILFALGLATWLYILWRRHLPAGEQTN